MDDLVWYAAYGSNLSAERFAAYLTGGTGGTDGHAHGHHHGARDATLPRADMPLTIPYRLVFAGQSRRWNGGGVAFLDPSDPTLTPGRAWLITTSQFADVYAQENGLEPSAAIEADLKFGRQPSRGWYRQVLDLAPLHGVAVRTFTHPNPAELGFRPPDSTYLAVINRGRAEADLLPLSE